MANWVNTVSRDHVERGVAGGFTQANHGKPHMLRKMARGDWIVFYSPKTAYQGGEPLQAFTAIGRVADDEPYQVQMSADFHPWRRNVDFVACTAAPIRPLLEKLDFIEDTSRWGYKFRFGVFAIDDHDLDVIRAAMTEDLQEGSRGSRRSAGRSYRRRLQRRGHNAVADDAPTQP